MGKSMKMKNKKKIVMVIILVGAMLVGSSPNVNAYEVVTGTPYTNTGGYDVTVPHVIINQVYGGGNNKGAASHGFIELYNPTVSSVDVSTWSVQYQGAQSDDKNDAGWHKLDLTGTIPSHCSYLIRTKSYKETDTPHNYQVPTGDMQWSDISMNGKGLSVVLMSNQTLLSDNDVFSSSKMKPSKSGYVDMVGVNGNDGLDTQKAPDKEGDATSSQSTKKGIRRIAFQDTDCNAVGEDEGDFQVIQYDSTDADYIQWAHPRRTSDGSWEATQQPDYKETTSLSSTSINTLTNTFGNDVGTTRQFTWEMPREITTGQVWISEKADMTNAITVVATSALNHKETANVFHASATGLSASTKYYYQVNSGNVQSPIYSFTTGNTSDAFTFIHASDSQSETESGYDTFQAGMNKMSAVYHPSFILETGDLVETNYFEDEWRWLIGKAQTLFGTTAYIPVVGNHEQSSTYDAWAFREHFQVPNPCTDSKVTPGTVYSYDYGQAHFAVLNSECMGEGLTAQANWLRTDLGKTKQKYIIVAMHRGIYGASKIIKELQTTIEPVLDEYKVDLVLFGHNHSYIRTKALKNGALDPDGTIYLQGGGCADKQDEAAATMPSYAEITGAAGRTIYNVITVSSRCLTIQTVTYDVSGNSLSSFEGDGSLQKADKTAMVDFSILPKERETGGGSGETSPPTTSPTIVPPTTPTQTPISPVTPAPTTISPVTTTPTKAPSKGVGKPGKVKSVILKAGKKKITLSWKKVKAVKYYQVKYATDKKLGANKKTIASTKNLVTLKKLKTKRMYYVVVRACGKDELGKTVYGAWSTVKKIKTK